MRRRLILKLLLLGLVVVVVGVLVVGGWVLWQVRRTPDYWRDRPAGEPTAEADAERFEFRLQAAMSRVRDPAEPWALVVRTERINDWLVTRLPQWAEHDPEVALPAWVGHPMIATERGRIVAAAALRFDGRSRVVSFAYRPTRDPDGVAALELSRIRVGKLWLPPTEATRRVVGAVGGLSAEAEAELEAVHERWRRIRLAWTLDDGRVVAVGALAVEPERLIARCRTRPDGAASGGPP